MHACTLFLCFSATSSSSPAQSPKDLPVIAVPSTQKVIAPMASKLAAKLATSTGSATPNAKTVILPDTNSHVNPVSIQNSTPAQGQVSVPVNTETKSSTQALNQVNMVAPSPKTNIVPAANTQTRSTHFVLQNQKLVPLVASQTLVTKPQGLLLVGNNTVPGSGQIFLTQPHGVVPVANMASQDLSGQRKMTSLLGSTAAQLKQEMVTHTAPGPQSIPQPVDTVVSGQTGTYSIAPVKWGWGVGVGRVASKYIFVGTHEKRLSEAFIMSIVFTLSIGTPYRHTMLLLKFEILHSITSCCVLNIAVCMANSVDPDQMPHSAASDQGLHCLQRPICPNT